MPPVDAVVDVRMDGASAGTVALATSRLAALHAHLRRASVANADHAMPGALRPAVRAYRVIDAALPQSIRLASGEERIERGTRDRSVRERYWRVLAAAVLAAGSIDELRHRSARTTAPLADDVRVEAILARVADALALGWDAYGRQIWPSASTALAQRTRWWAASVAPRSAAALAALRHALGAPDAVPVPRVLLVPDGGDRGAAFRTLAGPIVVVVDAGHHRGAELVEAVFHGIAHALDAAAPSAGTLAALRATLRAAGLPGDVVEETVQATIVALVASVTRERFDGLYADAGERDGAHGRGLRRFHEAVEGPVRALRAGRADAVSFARAVAEVAGWG